MADELGHGCLVMLGWVIEKELMLPAPALADECLDEASGRQGEKDESRRLEVVPGSRSQVRGKALSKAV